MVCPVVLEREQLVQGRGFKMQLRDFFFFPLVRVCLIITAVEWLAIVRNLLFPLSERPDKAAERVA